MNFQIPITALILFVLGGIAGSSLTPSSDGEADSQASDSSAAAKSTRTLTKSSRSNTRIPGDARMRMIRDSQNESDRLNSAIELAKSLPLNQAGKWLSEGLFSQREGFALTLFTRTLEQRWKAEDPDGYLIWQLREGKEISTEEMDRLLQGQSDLLLASIRLIQEPGAQVQALANLAKSRPDLALAELGKMDVAALKGGGNLKEILNELAKADLSGLQSAFDNLPLSLQEDAQGAIYGELLAKDFSGTVSQLAELSNGLEVFVEIYSNDPTNRQLFLKSFVNLPAAWQKRLENETNFLTKGMEDTEILATHWDSYGLSKKAVGRITGDALFDEARKNKPEALKLFQDADLNEAGRRHFLDMLTWNRGRDIIEELMPNLEPADQEYITQRLESTDSSFFTPTPKHEYQTAADLSESLARKEVRSFEDFESIYLNWDSDQKEQFLADYSDMRGEERHLITAVLANSRDQELQATAINEFLGSPEAQKTANWDDSELHLLTSNLAVDFLTQDPDRATSWVASLPEGESRSWAMKNLAANWKNYDPASAESWVNSLPETEQEKVRAFLENPGP